MLRRSITVDRQYLVLPVAKGPMSGHLRLRDESGTVREFDIRLADGAGDYQVFSDLEPYRGAKLTVEYEGDTAASLDGIFLADEPVDPGEIYRERLRPQFHFSSRRGWNNDPNGLFYYGGEYHLLYQHNPYSTDWGNLHWGHAVSTDLVQWTELPVALYPDALGTMSTGSSVVDYENTSGLGSDEGPAIVAVYTAGHADWVDEFTQCVAFSTDGGRSWTKYDGNPVMGHIIGKNRDPKVIWHPETERWIMPLYMDQSDYAIFASPNLLEWEHVSDFTLRGATECPELFPLPVDGDEDDRRWVFWGANSTYAVGSFDGTAFRPEQSLRMLQPDGCAYAAQTWGENPDDDRLLQMAWFRQVMPGMPFGQFMTIPWSLGLIRRDDGIVLTADPVQELEVLWEEQWQERDVELTAGTELEAGLGGELLDLEVDIDLGEADSAGVVVRGVPVWYDRSLGALFCGSYTALMTVPLRSLRLRILADRTSIEVFADGGTTLVAAGVVLRPEDQEVRLFARGGSPLVRKVRVSRLRTAWPFGG